MNRVMVTGASGFIGRSLVQKLLNDGCYVYGVDVFEDGMKAFFGHKNFQSIRVNQGSFDCFAEYDLTDLDCVFHLGWAGQLGGPDLYDFNLQLGNVVMTQSLLENLIKLSVKKFIFCGSISHYKVRKDHPEVNADVYGLSKQYAGQLAMHMLSRNNIEGCVALLANTYGIGDFSQKAVNTLIRKFYHREQLTLIEAQTWNDWVYIDDTINGLVAIAEKGLSYQDYYIGHRTIPTFGDNLHMLKQVMNADVELAFGTYQDMTVADYQRIDLEALYRDTGFTCQCATAESLSKTVEWLIHKDEGE